MCVCLYTRVCLCKPFAASPGELCVRVRAPARTCVSFCAHARAHVCPHLYACACVQCIGGRAHLCGRTHPCTRALAYACACNRLRILAYPRPRVPPGAGACVRTRAQNPVTGAKPHVRRKTLRPVRNPGPRAKPRAWCNTLRPAQYPTRGAKNPAPGAKPHMRCKNPRPVQNPKPGAKPRTRCKTPHAVQNPAPDAKPRTRCKHLHLTQNPARGAKPRAGCKTLHPLQPLPGWHGSKRSTPSPRFAGCNEFLGCTQLKIRRENQPGRGFWGGCAGAHVRQLLPCRRPTATPQKVMPGVPRGDEPAALCPPSGPQISPFPLRNPIKKPVKILKIIKSIQEIQALALFSSEENAKKKIAPPPKKAKQRQKKTAKKLQKLQKNAKIGQKCKNKNLQNMQKRCKEIMPKS